MRPPETLNVLDRHNGFTAITARQNTLWRPGRMLKRGAIGRLVAFDELSFYQTNDNVTKAEYKVPGYAHRVATWWDNATGARIA